MICNITSTQSQLTGSQCYQKDKLLSYQIQYPIFDSKPPLANLSNINTHYERIALDFQAYCLNDLLNSAFEGHKYARENQFPLIPYEAQMEYTITYNEGCIFSLYYDKYTFTGGAHGNTTRNSDTWNAITGNKMTLKDFFPNIADYETLLITYINNQIIQQNQSQMGTYFENYNENVTKTFNEQQFYLTNHGIVIYFQQYDIAPYSSGIPTFTIPFSKKNCKK